MKKKLVFILSLLLCAFLAVSSFGDGEPKEDDTDTTQFKVVAQESITRTQRLLQFLGSIDTGSDQLKKEAVQKIIKKVTESLFVQSYYEKQLIKECNDYDADLKLQSKMQSSTSDFLPKLRQFRSDMAIFTFSKQDALYSIQQDVKKAKVFKENECKNCLTEQEIMELDVELKELNKDIEILETQRQKLQESLLFEKYASTQQRDDDVLKRDNLLSTIGTKKMRCNNITQTLRQCNLSKRLASQADVYCCEMEKGIEFLGTDLKISNQLIDDAAEMINQVSQSKGILVCETRVDTITKLVQEIQEVYRSSLDYVRTELGKLGINSEYF